MKEYVPKDGTMGISQLAVHNVLRTYSRQERLGRVHRAREGTMPPGRSLDHVTLSSSARKAQWLTHFATELVSHQNPHLSAGETATRAGTLAEELLSHHRDEVADDGFTPEAFESALRSLYAG
jgi:hypothetical protein